MSLSNEQRRDHVRIDGSLSATLAWRRLSLPATIVDISEGGARLRLVGLASPRTGERIAVDFDLEGTSVRLDAEVVRTRPIGDRWKETAVRFVDVPPVAADRIRRYVFATERALRARGLR